MILTSPKVEKTLKVSTQRTGAKELFGYSNIIISQRRQEITDVFVNFNYFLEYESDLSSKDLTISSMKLSQSSFAKEWDNENDDYWNSYL